MNVNVIVVNKRLIGRTPLSLTIWAGGREIERFNIEVVVTTKFTKNAVRHERRLILKNNNTAILTSEKSLGKTLQKYLAARGLNNYRTVYAVFTSANSSNAITSYL